MVNMSIRNIPEDIHLALKERALTNNRSAEAEVRAILYEAIYSAKVGGFGTRLHKEFAGAEGIDLEIDRYRDQPDSVDIE